MNQLLEISSVTAAYGRVQVLHDVSLTVAPGEIVAILGANGAGKTTTMRAISRMVRTTGQLTWQGHDVRRWTTEKMAATRLGHVPEGRGTFTGLSVEENLRLGMLGRPRSLHAQAGDDLQNVFALFGVLREMRTRPAAQLSGGQQQILAIARALLARPALLMIDEASLGLAPRVTADIYDRLGELRQAWDLSILVAEQNVQLALASADRAYVLESGRLVAEGTAAEIASSNIVERAYLGQ